ncbi:MAG TPA: hypothetical protein VJO12_06180 [Stellaceae bacterium]|nr:hypothetical protein [Stellaceae bacterium]
MALAGMKMSVGRGNLPAGADDEASRRAAGETTETSDGRIGTVMLVELANATLEGVEDLAAREHGQEAVAVHEIDEQAALGRLDPAIGAGDQGGRGDHRVQQLVVAVIQIGGHDLGRRHA